MTLNYEIDWKNFSSCLVIESLGEGGITSGLGVAVRDNVLLTTSDLFQKNVIKINVYSLVGTTKKRLQFEVECFDLHPEQDVIRIKIKEKLPSDMMIYPIMKDRNNFNGKLFRLGLNKDEKKRTPMLIQTLVSSIDSHKKSIELFEKNLNPAEAGSGIFIVREGQIYLLGLLSLKDSCKKKKISKNPLVLGLNKWIESSWHDRNLLRV
jgi:hypothetical protein